MKLEPRQEQWLADLPKYAKAKGCLYEKDRGFCCLGVYAETQVSTAWGVYGTEGVLDSKSSAALGLGSEDGTFTDPIRVGESFYWSLVDLNDNGPFTDHAQMATFIREHADKIFTEPK